MNILACGQQILDSSFGWTKPFIACNATALSSQSFVSMVIGKFLFVSYSQDIRPCPTLLFTNDPLAQRRTKPLWVSPHWHAVTRWASLTSPSRSVAPVTRMSCRLSNKSRKSRRHRTSPRPRSNLALMAETTWTRQFGNQGTQLINPVPWGLNKMNDFRVSRDNFLLLSILFFVEN